MYSLAFDSAMELRRCNSFIFDASVGMLLSRIFGRASFIIGRNVVGKMSTNFSMILLEIVSISASLIVVDVISPHVITYKGKG